MRYVRWRILPRRAAPRVAKILRRIAKVALKGPTAESRELAWLAFFFLPVLLLRAKLRSGEEVSPQRIEGEKPDQIITDRASKADKGRWEELIHEFNTDVALNRARPRPQAPTVANPGDPVSAQVADSFCRLASTTQDGKAARQVTQAPCIPPCQE